MRGVYHPVLYSAQYVQLVSRQELNHLAFHTFAGRIRQARWWCRGVGAAALLVLCQRVRCRSPHFAEEGGGNAAGLLLVVECSPRRI